MPASKKTRVDLKWNGKKVYKRMVAASQEGVNAVMSECEEHAKTEENHPNWRNQTGAAEGSVTTIDFAKPVGFRVVGVWGSKGVNYATHLEKNFGPWLRAAADIFYPTLRAKVTKNYKWRTRRAERAAR